MQFGGDTSNCGWEALEAFLVGSNSVNLQGQVDPVMRLGQKSGMRVAFIGSELGPDSGTVEEETAMDRIDNRELITRLPARRKLAPA